MTVHKQNNQTGHAPYNFVPFPEDIIKRYKTFSELPAHDASNTVGKQLLNGEITFDIVAQTPILVADGKGKDTDSREFVKNAKGEYEIPGSTLKGLLRQTVSIISLSNWTERIGDENFYYRGVAGKNSQLRKDYIRVLDIKPESINGKNITVARAVQAGYIVKKSKNQYVIYPAKTDGGRHGKSYYKCHERDFPALKNDIRKGFKVKDATFSVNEHGKINHLNDGKGNFKGKLLFSGPMWNKDAKKQKKTAYVVNEIDDDVSKQIIISAKDLKAYQADFDFRCKKFGNRDEGIEKKKFFKLPEEVGIPNAKPCFYIHKDGRLYFGYTAYLRLTYDYTTNDLLPKHLKEEIDGIDYSSSLFGFINNGENQVNYSSRLSFNAASLQKNTGQKEVSHILGQPRASALSMYLKHEKDNRFFTSYNESSARLRGGKQYWIRKQAVPSNNDFRNAKVVTKLCAFAKHTIFTAKIQFNQLHDDELGLLLWALQGPAHHQIGMAKPYGYGVVKFQNVKCSVTTNEKMYQNLVNYFDIGLEQVNTETFIQKYKEYVKTNFELEVDQMESVATFLKMKEFSPLSEQEMNYMTLKEYQNMLILPTAQELLNNEKKTRRDSHQSSQRSNGNSGRENSTHRNQNNRSNRDYKNKETKGKNQRSNQNQRYGGSGFNPLADNEKLKNFFKK